MSNLIEQLKEVKSNIDKDPNGNRHNSRIISQWIEQLTITNRNSLIENIIDDNIQ